MSLFLIFFSKKSDYSIMLPCYCTVSYKIHKYIYILGFTILEKIRKIVAILTENQVLECLTVDRRWKKGVIYIKYLCITSSDSFLCLKKT